MSTYKLAVGMALFSRNKKTILPLIADLHYFGELISDSTVRRPYVESVVMFEYVFKLDGESVIMLRLTHGALFDYYLTLVNEDF